MKKKIIILIVSLILLGICLFLYFHNKKPKVEVSYMNEEVVEIVSNEDKDNNNDNVNTEKEEPINIEDVKTEDIVEEHIEEETTQTELQEAENKEEVKENINSEQKEEKLSYDLSEDIYNISGIKVENSNTEEENKCINCYLDKYEEGESIIYVHPITDEEVIFIITGDEDYYVSNLDFFSSNNLSLEEAFKEIEDLDFINLTEYLES